MARDIAPLRDLAILFGVIIATPLLVLLEVRLCSSRSHRNAASSDGVAYVAGGRVIDDRILCTDCRELARNGDCLAARERRREDVSKYYGPADVDLPRRCEHFLPRRDAEDQRSGRERFQVLWLEYEARLAGRRSFERDAALRGLARAKAAIDTS